MPLNDPLVTYAHRLLDLASEASVVVCGVTAQPLAINQRARGLWPAPDVLVDGLGEVDVGSLCEGGVITLDVAGEARRFTCSRLGDKAHEGPTRWVLTEGDSSSLSLDALLRLDRLKSLAALREVGASARVRRRATTAQFEEAFGHAADTLGRGTLDVGGEQPVNLITVAREVCQAVKGLLGAMELSVVGDAQVATIPSDAVGVRQLVLALLLDSLARVRAQPSAKIEIRVEPQAPYVDLVVADDGPGMSDEELAALFSEAIGSSRATSRASFQRAHTLALELGGDISVGEADAATMKNEVRVCFVGADARTRH